MWIHGRQSVGPASSRVTRAPVSLSRLAITHPAEPGAHHDVVRFHPRASPCSTASFVSARGVSRPSITPQYHAPVSRPSIVPQSCPSMVPSYRVRVWCPSYRPPVIVPRRGAQAAPKSKVTTTARAATMALGPLAGSRGRHAEGPGADRRIAGSAGRCREPPQKRNRRTCDVHRIAGFAANPRGLARRFRAGINLELLPVSGDRRSTDKAPSSGSGRGP